MLIAVAVFAGVCSGAAFAQTSSLPPAPASRIAVNPITNKVYVADEASNTLVVYDPATGSTKSIGVGSQPRFVAVNPITNRVYVDNSGDATLSVIDGSTDTNLSSPSLPIGSNGPIAINAATNTVYIVRLTGTGSDEVTFFNGSTDTWYTIATNSFQPIALAVNPLTDKIYVAHYATGDLRIISGAWNPNDTFPASVSVGMWSHPTAVAVNPVTNKVYVITGDSRGPIGILDGATNTATFPLPAAGHAQGPLALAVNTVTNRVYAAFSGEVIVIDGASNAYTYVPVDTGAGQVGLAVNATTNKVFLAADDGTLSVIDGDTNAVTTIPIPTGSPALGVNPVTDTAFVYGTSVTAVPAAAGDTAHAIPLTTSISSLPQNASGPDASFRFNASSAFTPNAPPVQAVYYQLDSIRGAWTQASGSGPYSAAFSGLSSGSHTLYAFAADGQQVPRDTGPQSAPLVGSVASYTFHVSLPTSVSLASSLNPAARGQAVALTASVSSSSGTPTGTVTFLDGGNAISGCSAVTVASAKAVCSTSSLAAGSHSIVAQYSGDASFGGSSSSAVVETITLAPAAVSLSSSANPSRTGTSVTFTANVSGAAGAPTGTVDFMDGSTALAGCSGIALSAAGSAACSTASLGAGSHSIEAKYSGDASYAAAQSSALAQSVQNPPPAQPTVSLSSSSIAFGGQSMGTTAPAQSVTLTNTGAATLSVTGISASDAQFAANGNCASLAPGASCTISVTFTPAAAPGPIGSTAPVSATLSIVSNAASSPDAVALSGTAEKSLVTHFYVSVLQREPDASGKSFWEGEVTRMTGLGANVNEVWYAMAMAFFSSTEYAGFARDDAGFVADLYETFFNRAPDPSGLSYWTGQLSSGMPRGVVLVSFMFSTEFASFTQSIFGNTAARAEIDVVGDFYRGLLARLPDSSGFAYWVQQFQAAQCQGAGAVYTQVESISSSFADGAEYLGRNRTNAEYVGDLYNAFLRRGGDAQGVQYWIQQLDSGAQTRDQVRRAFIATQEFSNRVNAIVSQGCIH